MHKGNHEFRANSGRKFDNRAARDGVICEQVLNTPLIAECRTRQTCGIFMPIGFLWSSVGRNKTPERGILSAVYERCSSISAAPLNKGRSLNNLIGANMANANTQGDPRPQSVSRSAIEKRVKRHLAKSGFSLVKSRPGTRQHDALGDYSIFDTDHELIADKIDLVARARQYGLMSADEQLSDATTPRTQRKASATTTNGMPTSAWQKLEGAWLCLESAAMALEDVVRGRVRAEQTYLKGIHSTAESALWQLGQARNELEVSQ